MSRHSPAPDGRLIVIGERRRFAIDDNGRGALNLLRNTGVKSGAMAKNAKTEELRKKVEEIFLIMIFLAKLAGLLDAFEWL